MQTPIGVPLSNSEKQQTNRSISLFSSNSASPTHRVGDQMGAPADIDRLDVQKPVSPPSKSRSASSSRELASVHPERRDRRSASTIVLQQTLVAQPVIEERPQIAEHQPALLKNADPAPTTSIADQSNRSNLIQSHGIPPLIRPASDAPITAIRVDAPAIDSRPLSTGSLPPARAVPAKQVLSKTSLDGAVEPTKYLLSEEGPDPSPGYSGKFENLPRIAAQGDTAQAPAQNLPAKSKIQEHIQSLMTDEKSIVTHPSRSAALHPGISSSATGHAGKQEPTGPIAVKSELHTEHPVTRPVHRPGPRAEESSVAVPGLAAGNQPLHVQPSAISSSADQPPKSVFAALDSDLRDADPVWTPTAANRAEAGFQDPALGWVRVHAQVDSTGVHATVVPPSDDARQVLSTHMAGLGSYLTEHHSPVDSWSLVSAATSHSAGGSLAAGGQGLNQGSHHPRRDSDPSHEATNPVEVPSPVPSTGGHREQGTGPLPVGAKGQHISLLV